MKFWTAARLAQLDAMLDSGMTDAAIAARFDTSPAAIKIAWTRYGLQPRSARRLSARAVARILGIVGSEKTVTLSAGAKSKLVNCSKCRRKVEAIDGRARYHRTRGVRCPGTAKLGYHPIHCCNCGQDVADGKLLEHIDSHDTRRRKRAA